MLPAKSDAPTPLHLENPQGDWTGALTANSRDADEVILARMRAVQAPDAFFPARAAVHLMAAIVRAKIDHALQLVRESSEEQAQEEAQAELLDAAFWLLDATDIEHEPEHVASTLYGLVVQHAETIGPKGQNRGSKSPWRRGERSVDPDEKPKKRGRPRKSAD